MFLAAVLTEQRAPLQLYNLEIPAYLGVGQVLVKVAYSGICGAQLGEISGVKGADKYMPHLMGHEGSGVVEAVGPGVSHVAIGDHVVMHWRKGIGIESKPPKYFCPELGKEIGGGWVTSFNEYAVVSENRLTRIPESFPLDIAALLGCAVTTGLGLISNEVKLKMGQSIAVFGCGGVGLNVIQGAMLTNAYPILGVDIKDDKLRQASDMGASHICIPEVLDIFHSQLGPFDVIVDTTGRQEMMQLAWKMTAPNGIVCLVAQLQHDSFLSLQTLPMHQGKTLIGSDGGGTNPTVDIPRYVKLWGAFKLNLKDLITHCEPLPEINNLLDEIRAGKVGRALLKM